MTFPVTAPQRRRHRRLQGRSRRRATSPTASCARCRVLPGRMHLAQSRFVTLHERRQARRCASTTWRRTTTRRRINEQMVVTVDAQLFYTVLQALPYLVNYPYECTEQTLNRFVSTGIVSSALRRSTRRWRGWRSEMSKRDDAARDVRRRRSQPQDGARGDAVAASRRRAAATPDAEPRSTCSTRASPRPNRESALAKLRKAQTVERRVPVVPGRPAVAVHDALHPARLRQGRRVRRRRAEGHGAARLGATSRGTTATTGAACMARGLLLGVPHLPQLRRARRYPDAVVDAAAPSPTPSARRCSTSRFRHWKQHSPLPEGLPRADAQAHGPRRRRASSSSTA